MDYHAWFELRGEDGSDLKILYRREQVGLLWLACFRVCDAVFDESYPDRIVKFRCEIGRARSQFERGLALMFVRFPETEFELGEQPHSHGKTTIRGVVEFRRFLARRDATHVEMPLRDLSDPTGGYLREFLMHAVAGFTNPDSKAFYDGWDVKRGLRVSAGMSGPGAMTWGDVLRVVTMYHAGIVLRTVEEDGAVRGPRCLFTEDEFLRDRAMLAGVR